MVWVDWWLRFGLAAVFGLGLGLWGGLGWAVLVAVEVEGGVGLGGAGHRLGLGGVRKKVSSSCGG